MCTIFVCQYPNLAYAIFVCQYFILVYKLSIKVIVKFCKKLKRNIFPKQGRRVNRMIIVFSKHSFRQVAAFLFILFFKSSQFKIASASPTQQHLPSLLYLSLFYSMCIHKYCICRYRRDEKSYFCGPTAVAGRSLQRLLLCIRILHVFHILEVLPSGQEFYVNILNTQ